PYPVRGYSQSVNKRLSFFVARLSRSVLWPKGSTLLKVCCRCWPMAAHILQVAYYPTLQETRRQMLRSAGYQVTSVLGNDKAIGLDGAVIAAADLIVVGFSASHSVRAAMVLWFKAH